LSEETSDGRTVEETLVDMLLHEAVHGKNRPAAIREIFDRVEGRPRQHVEIEKPNPFQGKSPVEVDFFALFGKWPEELPGVNATELLERAKAQLTELQAAAAC
jgi:hypothetical protein